MNLTTKRIIALISIVLTSFLAAIVPTASGAMIFIIAPPIFGLLALLLPNLFIWAKLYEKGNEAIYES